MLATAHRPEFANADHSRGPYAIIVGLEVSVPVAEKSAAGMALRDEVPPAGADGADDFVLGNKQFELPTKDAPRIMSRKPKSPAIDY